MTRAKVKTFERDELFPIKINDLTWALYMLRHLLRDIPDEENANYPENSYSDDELKGALQLDALTSDAGLSYYRPHVSAKNLFLGDPYRLKTHASETYSKTLADPTQVTNAWLEQGKRFDALIPDELLGVAPTSIKRKRKRSTQVIARRR